MHHPTRMGRCLHAPNVQTWKARWAGDRCSRTSGRVDLARRRLRPTWLRNAPTDQSLLITVLRTDVGCRSARVGDRRAREAVSAQVGRLGHPVRVDRHWREEVCGLSRGASGTRTPRAVCDGVRRFSTMDRSRSRTHSRSVTAKRLPPRCRPVRRRTADRRAVPLCVNLRFDPRGLSWRRWVLAS